VGQSLAKSELYCVLAKLCADYNFSVDNEGTKIDNRVVSIMGCRLFVSKKALTEID